MDIKFGDRCKDIAAHTLHLHRDHGTEALGLGMQDGAMGLAKHRREVRKLPTHDLQGYRIAEALSGTDRGAVSQGALCGYLQASGLPELVVNGWNDPADATTPELGPGELRSSYTTNDRFSTRAVHLTKSRWLAVVMAENQALYGPGTVNVAFLGPQDLQLLAELQGDRDAEMIRPLGWQWDSPDTPGSTRGAAGLIWELSVDVVDLADRVAHVLATQR